MSQLARHLRADIASMRDQLDAMEEAISLMRERLLFSLAQVADDVEGIEERQSLHEETADA